MRRFSIILITILASIGLLWARSANAEATFVCQPGATYALKGTGPANTALLLLFDERPVGGGTTDANGAYRLRLTIGHESPGTYPIWVEVRSSHQRVTSATCVIPLPPTVESGAVAGAANTAVPSNKSGTQPTSGAAATLTPTLSPSLNPSTAAATQTSAAGTGNSTVTTTNTTDTRATATTGTATTTATGSTATASATGSTTATATATLSPTPSATSDSSEDVPEISIDADSDDPVLGQSFVMSGDAYDANGDDLVSIPVQVTYAYDNADKGVWCSTTTNGEGHWECSRNVDAVLKDKDVIWTATITVNGQKYTETYEYTFDEST